MVSCSPETQPKPSGELRLEYPQPKYQAFSSPCNFTFEYSDFAKNTLSIPNYSTGEIQIGFMAPLWIF